MSFLGNVFQNNSENESNASIHWIELQKIEELEVIVEKSFNKPVLIFKHSTRCGISRFALKSFESSFDIDPKNIECYFLDLLSYRNISGTIAEKFKVQHQSPQAILVKDGVVVYHDSHSSISINEIKEFI